MVLDKKNQLGLRWEPRNRVFLRKNFVSALKFGKKPGFFGQSA